MATAEVNTNLQADELHDALLETFQKWVNFSLGVGKLGGKILRHPSGRMASALKAESDPDGHVVAIYLDQEALTGPGGADFLMSGHKGFSLKQSMLKAGNPGVRRSKDGHLYRYVPISDKPVSPRKSFASALHIKNLFTGQRTQQGGLMGINKNLARMWVSNYKAAHLNSGKVRTMSNKRGSARWYIPPMPAFSAVKLLKDSLKNQYRDRVIG
jgi:hypothetical protein